MSPELRADINRANALRSTGPKTDEGKARARVNALVHGFRARNWRLLDENPDLVEEISRFWNNSYNPQTPAACHYVTVCAQTDLHCQRVSRHLAALAAERQQQAVLDHEERRSQELSDRVPLWKADPVRAREWFSTVAVGACWVAEQWLKIRAQLADRARLSVTSAARATRLMGGKPGKALKQNPGAWTVRLFTLILGGTARPKAVARMFDPDVQPESLRSEYTPDTVPDRGAAFERLSAVVETELAHWQALEERLRDEEHRPALERAKALALVPRDPAQARRERRYEREARNAFDRAWAALQKVLAEDAARAAAEPAPEATPPDSPNEASPCRDGSDASPEPQTIHVSDGRPDSPAEEREKSVPVALPAAAAKRTGTANEWLWIPDR